MALIKCTECGHMISDKAEKCPKCGCPIEKKDDAAQQEVANSNRPVSNGNNKGGNSPKMLYAIIVVLVIALAVCGYWFFSNKGVSDKNMETNDSLAVAETTETMKEKEKIIRQRLTYIYDQVFSKLADDDLNAGGPEDDALWLTTEFNDLLKRDREITSEMGYDLGCYDHNHWTQSDDYDRPSMTIKSVEMISETEATAKIKIRYYHDSDYQIKLKVMLKHERGNWFIDDFMDYDGNNSEKKELKECLENWRF